MNIEELYKIKSDLTDKIRESNGIDKQNLIEQSRLINDQIKALKTNVPKKSSFLKTRGKTLN